MFYIGFVAGCATVTLLAWLFGHKKAPDSAATLEPERGTLDTTIVTRIEDLRKRGNTK